MKALKNADLTAIEQQTATIVLKAVPRSNY